jgi:hypothetical protein
MTSAPTPNLFDPIWRGNPNFSRFTPLCGAVTWQLRLPDWTAFFHCSRSGDPAIIDDSNATNTSELLSPAQAAAISFITGLPDYLGGVEVICMKRHEITLF